MIAAIEEAFGGVLLVAYLLVTGLFLARLVKRVVPHGRRCRLQAEHSQSGRVTVGEAQTPTSPSALPAAVRLRQARAALPPLTSAPAESTRNGERRERSDG